MSTVAIEAIPLNAIEKNVLTTSDYAALITVVDAEQYTEACEFIRAISRTRKEVEETFGPIKKKAHETWKESVAQEKKYLDPLEKAEKVVKGKIGIYLDAEEKKRLELEAAEREKARKEQDERALLEAAELERQGNTAAAEQVVQEAVSAPAPVVVIPKTVAKQEGISARKTWHFRVADASLVPREYLVVDEAKIGAVVRALKDVAKIPGVEIYSESSVSVRG